MDGGCDGYAMKPSGIVYAGASIAWARKLCFSSLLVCRGGVTATRPGDCNGSVSAQYAGTGHDEVDRAFRYWAEAFEPWRLDFV
jgi:hypothetical protein